MSNHYKFGRQDRALSPVVGTVFVFAFVVLLAGSIVLVGASAVDVSKDQAETKQLRLSMEELADSAASVAGERGRSKRVDLSASGSQVDPEAGRVRIAVDNGSETWETERSLGTVSYDREDTTIAYQGGGVWESAPDSSAVSVVSAPPIEYSARGEPTLTVPVLRVAGGSQTGDSLTVRSAGSAAELLPPSMVPLAPGSTVNLTVESAYYRGWGTVFERQVGPSSVSYDEDAESVTVTLKRPELNADATIRSGVNAPNITATGSVANTGEISSYDPDGSTGTSGAARFEDDLQMSNDGTVGGELHVDGDLSTSDDVTVTGPVYVSGAGDLANENYFQDAVSIGGDLTTRGSSSDPGHEFDGPVRVGGGLMGVTGGAARQMQAHDDVSVGEKAGLGEGAYVEGNLTAGGSVTLESKPTGTSRTVGGDLIAGENVTIEEGSVAGDVIAEGDVVLYKSATVEGQIRAGGDVIVEGGDHERVDRVEAGNDIILEPGTSVHPRAKKTGVERVVAAGNDVHLKQSSRTHASFTSSIHADVYAGNADGGYTSVVLEGDKTQIKGDVYVHDADTVKVDGTYDDFECTGEDTEDSSDRITGCIAEEDPLDEQPTPPSSADPDSPDDPSLYSGKPSVSSIVEAHSFIQTRSDNASAIEDGEIETDDTCSSPCTLPSGQYALELIDVHGGDTLELDTSDGPIDLYITDKIKVGGSDAATIEVLGDDRVTIYHDGDVTHVQDGSEVTTESNSARQLWLYQAPDDDPTESDFKVGSGEPGLSTFTGVFYGYEPDGPNTAFRVDNHGQIFGAALGEMGGVVNVGRIHYDETLADLVIDDSEEEYAEIVYLRSSDRSVSVG